MTVLPKNFIYQYECMLSTTQLSQKRRGKKKSFTYFLLKVRKKKKKITLDKQYIPIKVHCARINLGFSICV